MSQTYQSQNLDHLGLVAGMFEELGLTEVIDKATKQDPEMRIVTAGHAVKAMVLNSLVFVNQQLYLVPHFFHNTPTYRLIAPTIKASHLNDDTLGRALDTLYDYGVMEPYRLIAATAAKRLGLAPNNVMVPKIFLTLHYYIHTMLSILGGFLGQPPRVSLMPRP